MKMISRTIAAFGLLAATATIGSAQRSYLTDAGSPLGSGGGVTAAVNSAVSNAISNAKSNAAYVPPGNSAAPAAFAALVAALGGNAAPLSGMLSSVQGGGALATALAALGNNQTPNNVIAAIRAYNAAVDGMSGASAEARTAMGVVASALQSNFYAKPQ